MRPLRNVALTLLVLSLLLAACSPGDDNRGAATKSATSTRAPNPASSTAAPSPSGPTTDPPETAARNGVAFTNPVVEQRADPSIYRHTDGYYYMTASVPTYDKLELRRAKTLQGLGQVQPVVVWQAKDSGPQSGWVWAPEVFYIDGAWYIYYSAGDQVDLFATHRMYVVTTTAVDPTTGTWAEKGQIKTEWESFSLDETTFELDGQRYLIWAQQDPNIRNNSNLYIAKMDSPTSITGAQAMIGTPTFPWEGEGYVLNEAPQILRRMGRIFLSYSSSATDARYKMGLYTAEESADLLDPKSWTKAAEPVFQTSEENKVFGPGSNAFTVSEDGDDLLVYNARSYRDPEPDPLNDPNRSIRVQQLLYDEKGAPFFGLPVAEGPSPSRLRATATGQCLRHAEPAALADCADEAPQQFDFDHLGDGAYSIAAEGGCLAGGADAASFTDCDRAERVQWRIRPAGGGHFRLVEGGAGKRCLTAAASGPQALTACGTSQDQLWSLG